MSNNKPDQHDNDENKTVGPDKTVLSTPEMQNTMLAGDTAADADAVDPNATLKPIETMAEARPDDQVTSETVVVSPDSFQEDSEAETIEESPGVEDNVTTQTVLSSPDHDTAETILSNGPNDGAPRKGLEDHYETLAQDAQNPATGPNSGGGYVIGDYQVLEELGRGGMGVVYKARHRKLNRVVALKMILAGNHAGNEALERFITEARAVAHLQHPGIVQIFDIGEHEQLPYFSLEFVDGSDLQKKLDRQPQDAKYCARVVAKLASAMQYAHDNGILHRDLKPPNVLLDADGEPKITDFGLAKQVDGEAASTETSMGTIMGSPSYMPPEQARGEVSSLSPRSDLYSLGAILYEMLTGRPPFLAKKPLETVMQVVNNDPVSPRELQPEIPVDIETICLKAMQKDQAGRYEDCAALAEDLERFLKGEPIIARPVSRTERLMKWCRRNPKIALPSGLAMLAIVSTAVIATWAWQTTSAQAAVIATERDNAQEERDKAKRQRNIAQQEREKAEQQEAEAKKQTLIAEGERKKAEEQEAEAKRQAQIATEQKKVAEDAKEKAEEQRLIAVDAKEEAEEKEELARKQAEVAMESIQFVLTKVDSELKKQPQLSDVRIQMLDALTEKWDELDVKLTGGVDGQAIPTLMAIRYQLAGVYAELDELKKANREYEKLAEMARKRVEVKKGNDASRDNLASVLYSWAPMQKRLSNDSQKVVTLYKEAIAIWTDCLENPRSEPGGPTSRQMKQKRAGAHQNLCVEYMLQGRLDLSAEQAGEALQDNGDVLNKIRSAKGFADQSDDVKDSATAMIQLEYDRSALTLANIQLRRGETEEALDLYEDAVANRREIYERRSSHPLLKGQFAGFLSTAARAFLWLDKPNEAIERLKEAIPIEAELHTVDPDKAKEARSFATSLFRQGIAFDLLNEQQSAMEAWQKCHDVRTQLVANSDDIKNRVSLMLVDARLGNVPAALKTARDISANEESTTENHFDSSRAFAQASRHKEEADEKQKLIDEALTALERAVEMGYSDPFRIQHDNDFDPLHNEMRFKAIVARLKANQ